jgi:hypothetical protein
MERTTKIDRAGFGEDVFTLAEMGLKSHEIAELLTAIGIPVCPRTVRYYLTSDKGMRPEKEQTK